MAVASLASSAFTRIGDEIGPEATKLKDCHLWDSMRVISMFVTNVGDSSWGCHRCRQHQCSRLADSCWRLKAVFPTDIILSSLLAACPATMLTVLLLFSSGLTSDDVICSSRKLGLQTNSVNGDRALSYSQGLADFQFMNAYCHQNLVDFAGQSEF